MRERNGSASTFTRYILLRGQKHGLASSKKVTLFEPAPWPKNDGQAAWTAWKGRSCPRIVLLGHDLANFNEAMSTVRLFDEETSFLNKRYN